MHTLVQLFRQRRPLGLEQVTGLLMILGAALFYFRPQALTFDWIETLLDLPRGVLAVAGVLLLLVCGYGLALHVGIRSRWFGVLTAPIAGYGFLTAWYALSTNSASILPGYFSFALWVVLQVACDQARVISAWTNSSNPSSHS